MARRRQKAGCLESSGRLSWEGLAGVGKGGSHKPAGGLTRGHRARGAYTR